MLRLALDGLRSRALLSVGTLLLLVVALGSAVLGPAFTAAVGDSYAVTRLDEAPNPLTGRTWEFRPDGSRDDPAAVLADATGAVELPPGQHAVSVQLETLRVLTPGSLGEVQLLAREGACSHLAVTGRCPRQPGEVAVLAGDAEEDRLALGDRIDLAAPLGPLTVVGTYRYPTGPDVDDDRREELEDFWFDTRRLASLPPQVLGAEPLPRRPAPFLVALDHFATVPPDLWLARVDSRVDARPDLSDDELAALADEGAADPLPRQARTGTLAEVSINDLGGVVGDIRAEQRAAVASVTPAVASLVLVALVLLSRLTAAAGELRVPDLALASLRGAGRRRVWVLALSEPLLLVLLALPIGVAGGLGLDALLVRAWLEPGLPLSYPAAAYVAAAAVTLCAVGVCVAATRTVLARTLADQLAGQARPRASGRLARLGLLVLVALAVVMVTAAVTRPAGEATDVGDLVLPALVAAALGVAATAAARWASGRLARRRARGVVGFLAVRAVARRSVGTLVVLPLTVAIAVCTFGLGIHDAAATWRASVAATQAPADTVWATELSMVEAVALTHELDPDGRWLMAAATLTTQEHRVAVVDAPRLERVATWPDAWTPGTDAGDVADLLSARPLPTVAGRRLELTATVPPGSAEVTVELQLGDADGRVRATYLGPFGAGTSTRVERVPCAAGCTVEGLAVAGGAGLPTDLDGEYALGPLTVDGEDATAVLADEGWTLSSGADLQQAAWAVATTPAGLAVTASERGIAGLTAGGIPPERPVVAGREAGDDLDRRDLGAATSSAGGPPRVRAALVSESVPFLGPRAYLIDHTMMTANRTVFDDDFEVRVLARGDTPADVSDALAAAGLTVTTTYAQERDRLDETAYALALRLYVVASALVLLMAVAGLAVTTAVQLPARRADAASLSVVGVRRRTVLLAVALEQAVVLGAAALAGLVAGAGTQLVVLRRITLGAVEGLSWPRVTVRIDPALLAGVAAGVGLLLAAVAVVSAWLTVRRARGASLRERGR